MKKAALLTHFIKMFMTEISFSVIGIPLSIAWWWIYDALKQKIYHDNERSHSIKETQQKVINLASLDLTPQNYRVFCSLQYFFTEVNEKYRL